MEGEKDPRNLLLAFSIHRVILIEFDVQNHVEVSNTSHRSASGDSHILQQDLHDIVFCYFPITFKPPPNDPYGISTDELRISLRYDTRLDVQRYQWLTFYKGDVSPLRHCLDRSVFHSFSKSSPPLAPASKLSVSSPGVLVTCADTAMPQRDTLQTMAVCIPVYGSAIILKFAETIWNALKVEVSSRHSSC